HEVRVASEEGRANLTIAITSQDRVDGLARDIAERLHPLGGHAAEIDVAIPGDEGVEPGSEAEVLLEVAARIEAALGVFRVGLAGAEGVHAVGPLGHAEAASLLGDRGGDLGVVAGDL